MRATTFSRRQASFSDDVAYEDRSARLRTALDADGQWLPTVLVKADEKLRQLRKQQPDAGGLVIAIDQDHARACAALLERWTGERPAIALSYTVAGAGTPDDDSPTACRTRKARRF